MASYSSSHHHFYGGGDTAASSSGGGAGAVANYNNNNLFPPSFQFNHDVKTNNELVEEEERSNNNEVLFSPTVAAIRNKPHTLSHSIFSPQAQPPPPTTSTKKKKKNRASGGFANNTVRDKENAVPTPPTPQHANNKTPTSAWSLLQSTKTKPTVVVGTPFPHLSHAVSPTLTEFHTPAQTATPFGGLLSSSLLSGSSFGSNDNDEDETTTTHNNTDRTILKSVVLSSPYKSLPSLRMMTTEYIDNCFDLNTVQHIVDVLKNQKDPTYPYLLKNALRRYNELVQQEQQLETKKNNDITTVPPIATTTRTTPSNQNQQQKTQYRYRAPTPYVKRNKFNTAIEDSLDEDGEEDDQQQQQRRQQPYRYHRRAPTPYVRHKFNTDHHDSLDEEEEENEDDDDNNNNNRQQQQQQQRRQQPYHRALTPYVKRSNKFAEDSLELSCSDDDNDIVQQQQYQEGVALVGDVDCSADLSSSNPVIALTGYRTKSAYKPNHIFRRTTSTSTPAQRANTNTPAPAVLVQQQQQQTHQQYRQQPSSGHYAAAQQQEEELAHELACVTQQLQDLQAVHARDQQHHKEQIETLEQAKVDAQNKYRDALELCDETSNEYQKALDQYKQQCRELHQLYQHEKQSNQKHLEKVGQLSRRIDELTKQLELEKKKCSTSCTDWESKHKGLHELLKSSQQNLRNVQDERDTILRSLVVQVIDKNKNSDNTNIKKLSKEERTKLLGNLIRQIAANQSAVRAMAGTVNTAEMDRNKSITKYRKLKQLLSQGKEMNDQLLYEQSRLKNQLVELQKESKTWRKIKTTNQIHQLSAQQQRQQQQQEFQQRELDYKNTIQSLRTQLTMIETTAMEKSRDNTYNMAAAIQDSQNSLKQRNEYEKQINGLNQKLSHLEKELKQQQKQQPSSSKLATTSTMKNQQQQQRSKPTFALPASRIPLPATTTTNNPPPPPLQKVSEKTAAASTTKKTPPPAACPPPPPPATTTPKNNNLLLRASSSLRKAGGGISRKAMEEKVRLARSRSPKPRQPLQNLQN